MQLKFTKMHSDGIDFVIVESITSSLYLRSATIERLADRVSGVGFNGLIIIEHPKQADVDFDCLLYGQDGLPQPMSYAAARCATRYILDNELSGYRQLKLSFGEQLVQVAINDKRQIAITLPNTVFEPAEIGLQVERYRSEYDLPVLGVGQLQIGVLQLGELHAVVRVDDVEQVQLPHWGAQLQQQQYFEKTPQVSFIQMVDEHHLRLNCYQRQSHTHCEHIAAAAVVSAQLRGWLQPGVTVVWGDRQFWIEWQPQQPIEILGIAKTAFDGRVYI